MDWQSIETAPNWKGPYSLRLLGILDSGHYVFVQYTPYYLDRDPRFVWAGEGFGWATKPTHWMPLPEPPGRAG